MIFCLSCSLLNDWVINNQYHYSVKTLCAAHEFDAIKLITNDSVDGTIKVPKYVDT